MESLRGLFLVPFHGHRLYVFQIVHPFLVIAISQEHLDEIENVKGHWPSLNNLYDSNKDFRKMSNRVKREVMTFYVLMSEVVFTVTS